MSEALERCPNCQEDLKNSFLKNNRLISQNKTNIINEYIDSKSMHYCSKCGDVLYDKYRLQFQKEKSEISNTLKNLISSIPVITTHSPLNWRYNILEMVTGQSTTGTGVLTEFTSTFTDLIGSQSGRHNQKIKAGEEMCFFQLRKQTLDLGGNAVIATDIDYSEVGAGKGMLMVCMSGTAVSIYNPEILGVEKEKRIDELQELNSRLNYLNQFNLEEY
ncbi:heavy metal-binding domain-containing protein [Salegentibacter sp. Hel_I_6]|uniref:heavy metal-binding domain-containing protein n=1 Tax=Salegentibacter sp. Hel_I_6 TaxID=1250278 RepID=UPI00055FB8C9|nr:heavy metal-binding domain-containing protein [Salegentibacter sp. Hel_I_6]